MKFIEEYNVEKFKETFGEEDYLKIMAKDYLDKTDSIILDMFEELVKIDNAIDLFKYLRAASTDFKDVLEKRIEAKEVLKG